MNRRSAIRRLLASALSFLTSPVHGRSRAGNGEPQTFRADVGLVLLDVSVTHKNGSFVSGLAKESFTVLEDGRPQRITVFDNNDLPVTVGILVDESGSMAPKRSDVLAAAQLFIEESNRRDEIFVLHFNDRVTPGLPRNVLFSDDVNQLRSALYQGVPEGRTALNDAVVAGLEQLHLGRQSKRALVLISDGGDNASEHKRSEMLNLVERSLATIYTIGLFDLDDPDRDPAILRKLAGISGGEAYFPRDGAEMKPVCSRIAKGIRARYTVGYPSYPGRDTGSLRWIQVRVSASGQGKVIVRTRSSYRL